MASGLRIFRWAGVARRRKHRHFFAVSAIPAQHYSTYADGIKKFQQARKKMAAANVVADKRTGRTTAAAARTPLAERYAASQYVAPRESTIPDGPMATMAERQIERAMREGDFDNLPGEGKPLQQAPLKNWMPSASERGTDAMLKVMGNANVRLESAVARDALRDALAAARAALDAALARAGGNAAHRAVAEARTRAFRDPKHGLHALVERYNQHCLTESVRFGKQLNHARGPVDEDAEVRAAVARFGGQQDDGRGRRKEG